MYVFDERKKANKADRSDGPVMTLSPSSLRTDMAGPVRLLRAIGNQGAQRYTRTNAESTGPDPGGKRTMTRGLASKANKITMTPRTPCIQRQVDINDRYAEEHDYDPAVQFKRQDRALGKTIPILNGAEQVPRLNPRKFERALNLPVLSERNLDAIARPDLNDPALDGVRNNLVELKKGWTGKHVKLVQQALIAWGQGLDEPQVMLANYGADGIFGDETENGVRFFQGNHPVLVNDGIVGDLTLAELQREMDRLHGSIFAMVSEGYNDYRGAIHVPLPPANWSSATVTNDEFYDNKAVDQYHKAEVAGKCHNQPKMNFVFSAHGDVVSAVLAHEQLHQSDQLDTVRRYLPEWDTRLKVAKLLKWKARAKDKAEAMQRLFAESGADAPDVLSRKIIGEFIAGNIRRHPDPASEPTSVSVDASNCNAIRFIYSPR